MTSPNDLQTAAASVTAMHDAARQMIRTKAHLRAWLVARERGIANTPAAGGHLGPEDCDALADAALDGMFELMAEWASGLHEEEA